MEVTDTDKHTSGVYYKHVTIINDDSSIVNKFQGSLTDDTRVVIYDHHRFIVQATAYNGQILIKTIIVFNSA